MNDDKNQIDLRDYWAIIIRRKIFIILPVMIIPLVAFLTGYFIPPVYESSVTLLIDESNILPPDVERQFEGRSSYRRIETADRQRTIFSQITSSKYLKRLIAILDIPITPKVREIAAEYKSVYPEISENELAETIIADDLRKKISVGLSSNNLMSIMSSASNPVVAQKRAKTLASIYIEEKLAQALAGVRTNIAFSEEQLVLYREKLNAAENKLKDFSQQLIVNSAGEDTSGLLQIMSAIETIDFEISTLKDKLHDYRGLLIADGIDVSSIILPADLIKDKERMLSKISTMADLLTKYGWKDPKVLNLNKDIKEILTSLDARINSSTDEKYASQPETVRETISEYLIVTMAIELNRSKKNTLNQSMAQIKSRLSDNPDFDVTMERLQSEVDFYKDFYDLFIERSQFAVIDQAAKKVEAEAKYVIVKPASMPLAPKSPDKKKLLIMGLVLGLVLGGGVIIILEILDSSFKKVEELEAFLSVKVLGTIPKMNLPYGQSIGRKVPYIIGVGISFALVIWIIVLRTQGNG